MLIRHSTHNIPIPCPDRGHTTVGNRCWTRKCLTQVSWQLQRRESTRCLEGRRALKGQGGPPWGRVTKPRPIDSGGHELHVGNPSGLIPVFTLLTFGTVHHCFFQETFFTWLLGHQSLLIFTHLTGHSFSASPLWLWPSEVQNLFPGPLPCLHKSFTWTPDPCVQLPTWKPNVKVLYITNSNCMPESPNWFFPGGPYLRKWHCQSP